MSLPERAIFELVNGELKEGFCNIGWYYDKSLIPRTVGEAMKSANLNQEDWNTVTLYGETYTKKDLNDIMKHYYIMTRDKFKKQFESDYNVNDVLNFFKEYYPKNYKKKYDEMLESEYQEYRDTRNKEINKSN